MNEQLAEWVLHAQKPGVGVAAIEDDVEPVAVAQVARLGPLVFAPLDVADGRSALDLDGAIFAVGMFGQLIEARPIAETLGAGKLRRK